LVCKRPIACTLSDAAVVDLPSDSGSGTGGFGRGGGSRGGDD